MEIIHRISGVKYYSLNAYHFIRGGGFSDDNQRKKTLEFRIAEGLACIDSLLAKNWIRFFLHFVEMTKNRPLPRQYRSGDPWSSLLWLNPSEVIAENGYNTGLGGIWSNQGRSTARKEIEDFIEKFKPQKIDDEDAVYGKNYIL
jgi:hypothetical protein